MLHPQKWVLSKRNKNLLHFVECSKGELSETMAELLESQESPKIDIEKSPIESKLDEILEKIKPMEEISKNVKTLTEKLLNVEKLKNLMNLN